jgi:hypothetical protein
MIRHPVIAGIAAMLASMPARAEEYTRFEPLVVSAAARPGDEAAGCTRMALLNLPAAWRTGDAAVVMLAPWQAGDPARDRLVGALLHEQAAVLELVPCAAADPLPDAMGALVALRRDAGAGVVVAIGYGPGARRMLDTIAEHEAAARLGETGPRFAAAAALGEGAPGFALGVGQPTREGAPWRLGLLCAALGEVAGALAEAQRAAPEAGAAQCRTALAGLHGGAGRR